jgi:hypothetical protein
MPPDLPPPILSTANSLATAFDRFEPTTKPAADWSAAQNWSAGQLPSGIIIGVVEGIGVSIDPGINLNANILLQSSLHATGLIGNGGAIAFGTANQLSLVATTDLFAEDSLINQGVIALTIAGTQLENSGTIALDGGALITTDGATSNNRPTATDGTISLVGTATASFSDAVSAQIFNFAPSASATLN